MQDHYRATELCGTIFHTRQFQTAGPAGPATLVVLTISTMTGLKCAYGDARMAEALSLLQLSTGDRVRLTLDPDCTVTTVEAAL